MPKTFYQMPEYEVATPLLKSLKSPSDLKYMQDAQLLQLADELREYLLYCVGLTGGHFAAGLGVVELTVALHKVFNTPDDRIIWDVGHQAYPHKILTDRRDRMNTLRKKDGLSAFPKRSESPYDAFGTGHSSTSISAALGMALASKIKHEKRHHVAVIGDGALTAGMAFEALSHGGDTQTDMLVILNDNDMSISKNVGGLSNYLSAILSSKPFHHLKDGGRHLLSKVPKIWELALRTEEHAKEILHPGVGTLFEKLGWQYHGPVDGHDLKSLIEAIYRIKMRPGPQFLHVITQKGHGFAPAEKDPIRYHAIGKSAPVQEPHADKLNAAKVVPLKFSSVFGQWLCDMAAQDARLIGITPAMCEGSEMIAFSQTYPERYFDVAIAEQHAVTLAAGMACEAMKPVVAIYSTFLQRGYDQLIHDVTTQNLDVLFAIDRAGLVGEDGPTHAGVYDISYLRCIPQLILMTPSDENELRLLLTTGYMHAGPAAVRYPRGLGSAAPLTLELKSLPLGQAAIKREGKKVVILAFGPLVHEALKVAEKINATVVDMRYVKPLDETCILNLAKQHDLLVTVEDNAVAGGAGSAVAECLQRNHMLKPLLILGIPDEYIAHDSQAAMQAYCGLSAQGIEKEIKNFLKIKI